MDASRSTGDSGGLLSVSRRSIRRLAHAVKRKPGSPTTQSVGAAPAESPTRNTTSCETFSKGRYSFRWKKSTSKKFVLQGDATKQEQTTESAGRTPGQKGTSVQRKTSKRKSSMRCANKTKGRPLVSWPFKRSQGKLDLQKLTSQEGRPVCERVARNNSNRKKVGGKTYTAIKTKANEMSECGTPKKGTVSAGAGQRVTWKDAGGEGDDAAQRRTKRRRRRRKSQSDAEDSHYRSKPPKQTRVVASLCTPKRPRREEQPHRCKPKKLAVTKEEFLSLKKKLEWELAFNLYCRQKREFMEINKHMYECDECDARVMQRKF